MSFSKAETRQMSKCHLNRPGLVLKDKLSFQPAITCVKYVQS